MASRSIFHAECVSRVHPSLPGSINSRHSHLFWRTQRYASTDKAPETDRSRILAKPDKFRPPSHGSRRIRPRAYPGPRLSEQEKEQQKTRRYPNMMPPEGTFLHYFLTDRRLHLWITLSTLAVLSFYSLSVSFLSTTIYRDSLPSWSSLLSHPIATMSQFLKVYKLHVAYESEQVATKRRKKIEDAKKREEFLRAHGVEPGFLTGTWLDKLGTVEGDIAKEKLAREKEEANAAESSTATSMPNPSTMVPTSLATESCQVDVGAEIEEEAQPVKEKKKVKMWLGIW